MGWVWVWDYEGLHSVWLFTLHRRTRVRTYDFALKAAA